MSPARLIEAEEEIPYGDARGDASGDGSRVNRRIAGIILTIAAEVLIIALLLTLGWNINRGDPNAPQVVAFEARNVSDDPPADAAEPEQPASANQAEPVVQPPEPEITPPPDLPTPVRTPPPALILPRPNVPPAAQPSPAPPVRKPPAKAPPGPPAQVYGPPDTGAPGGANDSQRVGTAPNGEPLYAARWYREPTRGELAGYLSTASGPGSALIVCRTVPDFYVEDCQLLSESPGGSQIGRAVMAAAWQFRVRPAIVGGRSQVGSWVRIRIDYSRAIQR